METEAKKIETRIGIFTITFTIFTINQLFYNRMHFGLTSSPISYTERPALNTDKAWLAVSN
jgi:hypothetical protein